MSHRARSSPCSASSITSQLGGSQVIAQNSGLWLYLVAPRLFVALTTTMKQGRTFPAVKAKSDCRSGVLDNILWGRWGTNVSSALCRGCPLLMVTWSAIVVLGQKGGIVNRRDHAKLNPRGPLLPSNYDQTKIGYIAFIPWLHEGRGPCFPLVQALLGTCRLRNRGFLLGDTPWLHTPSNTRFPSHNS